MSCVSERWVRNTSCCMNAVRRTSDAGIARSAPSSSGVGASEASSASSAAGRRRVLDPRLVEAHVQRVVVGPVHEHARVAGGRSAAAPPGRARAAARCRRTRRARPRRPRRARRGRSASRRRARPRAIAVMPLGAVVDAVHRRHHGEQHLRGADVARRLLAADVLLARLQREPVGGVAVGVDRDADEAAGQLAGERVGDGHEAGVRAAEAHRHAEALRGADHDAGALAHPAPR